MAVKSLAKAAALGGAVGGALGAKKAIGGSMAALSAYKGAASGVRGAISQKEMGLLKRKSAPATPRFMGAIGGRRAR